MKYLILAISALALSLSSCNTVSGAGQDLQQGGAAVQNAAHNVAHGH